SSPSSDRRRTPDTTHVTRTRSSRSRTAPAWPDPPSPCQKTPSQLAPAHRRKHEAAEKLPAVVDADAPPPAATARRCPGSRDPAASDAIAPLRWPASPCRDELQGPERWFPPSSARRKNSGGSVPALPDRSSLITCEKMCAEKDRPAGRCARRPCSMAACSTGQAAQHATAQPPAS